MALSPRLQTWLEVRGYNVSSDPGFLRMVPWFRTTFLLCGSLVGIATAFAFTPLLWAMVPIAAAGAIFRVHPLDLVYNYGLRHLTGTGKLPLNGPPTRFACVLATPWVVAIALSFDLGVAPLGYALGALLTTVAYIVGTTHFCIPSFIYQYCFGDRELALRTVFGSAEEQAA